MRLWIKALLTTLTAIAVFTIIRFTYGYQPLLDDVSAFAGFYSAFGVLYGIMAAFVLVTVWEQYNAVETLTEKETNALRSIYRLASFLHDKKVGKTVQEKIKQYARAVAVHEWKTLASNKDSKNSQHAFESLLKTLDSVKVKTTYDTTVLNNLLREVSSLTDLRVQRINASKTEIPATSWILLLFLSTIMVISEYFLGVVNDIIAYMMITAIAGAVSLVIWIVKDLDNPFKGEWNLTPKSFNNLLKLGGV